MSIKPAEKQKFVCDYCGATVDYDKWEDESWFIDNLDSKAPDYCHTCVIQGMEHWIAYNERQGRVT